MKTKFFLFLERLELIDKRFRPKSFSAGPPALSNWHFREALPRKKRYLQKMEDVLELISVKE
jgi:hypothetical protein